ncbi:hypothetical protein PRBEI_2001878900 [Prionailurus iriomotensis]
MGPAEPLAAPATWGEKLVSGSPLICVRTLPGRWCHDYICCMAAVVKVPEENPQSAMEKALHKFSQPFFVAA